MSQYVDIDQIIDEYLEKETQQIEINLEEAKKSEESFEQAVEQDASEVFNQIMDKKREEFEKDQEKYDIGEAEKLKFFEKDDTIRTGLAEALGKSRKFLDSILEEKEYKEWKEKSAHEKCEWLVESNKYILIRDKDWEKIFTDIENNGDSFGRYYSIMRVKMDSDSLVDMCSALMINDDLYDYSKTLAEQLEE